MKHTLTLGIAAIGLISAAAAMPATAAPPEYGPPISLAQAKKIADAAAAASPKLSSQPDCIAIVDSGSRLVYFERMENAQIGSIRVALDKASSAAMFRRPTAVFAQALSKGATVLLRLHGASVLPGGIPIVEGGKVIGGLGVSGGTGEEDVKVATAALAALDK
jgi:glc operon protein GlcG